MEQHRVLIVILSLSLFVAVVLGAGLWLFYPRADQDQPAIAALTPEEEGREFDPIEYLRGDEEEPIALEPEGDDEIIIVYGEEPEAPEAGRPRAGEPTAGQPDAGQRDADGSGAGIRDDRVADQPAAQPSAPPAAGADQLPAEPDRRPATQTGSDAAADRATDDPGRDGDAARVAAAQPRRAEPPAARPAPQPSVAAARSVPERQYWIQLISSPSLDTVEQARRRLNEWTMSGLITSISHEDRTFYRLRVGPYVEKAEAEKFLDWIQDIEGFGTSYISLVYDPRVAAN